VKSERGMETSTFDDPSADLVHIDTSFEWRTSDGAVSRTSSELTDETINGRNRSWVTTILDDQGSGSVERGNSYTAKNDSGSELVTTTFPGGASRVDSVMWDSPENGTRTTNEKDKDGNITNSSTDVVVQNYDGKWEPKDDDDSDSGDSNPPPVAPGSDAPGQGDDPGSFGPGGPDGGDSSGSGSGDGNGDGDSDANSGPGDGDRPPDPIIPTPPGPHED
jgi:hypothetical protein